MIICPVCGVRIPKLYRQHLMSCGVVDNDFICVCGVDAVTGRYDTTLEYDLNKHFGVPHDWQRLITRKVMESF